MTSTNTMKSLKHIMKYVTVYEEKLYLIILDIRHQMRIYLPICPKDK